MNTAEILRVGERLVARLRSFNGDDCARGQEAAEIIGRTLGLFATAPEAARHRLCYDVGGKGMLDWGWSSEHRGELEKFSGELFALLQTTRQAPPPDDRAALTDVFRELREFHAERQRSLDAAPTR